MVCGGWWLGIWPAKDWNLTRAIKPHPHLRRVLTLLFHEIVVRHTRLSIPWALPTLKVELDVLSQEHPVQGECFRSPPEAKAMPDLVADH